MPASTPTQSVVGDVAAYSSAAGFTCQSVGLGGSPGQAAFSAIVAALSADPYACLSRGAEAGQGRVREAHQEEEMTNAKK
jgi:hypothetical protein